LVGLALVLVEAACRWRPAIARWLAGGTAALLILGLAVSFDVRDSAVRGTPLWSDSLDAVAAAQCHVHGELLSGAEGGPEVPVAISPPPFVMLVPCDEIGSP
jgi:hypothetical protein